MLLPPPEPSTAPSIEPSPKNPITPLDVEAGKRRLPKSEGEMLEILGGCRLDRERMEVWERWLELEDGRERSDRVEGGEEKLQDLVERNVSPASSSLWPGLIFRNLLLIVLFSSHLLFFPSP
jgi:hypothetical protein